MHDTTHAYKSRAGRSCACMFRAAARPRASICWSSNDGDQIRADALDHHPSARPSPQILHNLVSKNRNLSEIQWSVRPSLPTHIYISIVRNLPMPFSGIFQRTVARLKPIAGTWGVVKTPGPPCIIPQDVNETHQAPSMADSRILTRGRRSH